MLEAMLRALLVVCLVAGCPQPDPSCEEDGTCACDDGWEGADCRTPICEGGCGSGTCTAPDTCDCPGGFDPDAACATCLDGHVGPVCDACPTDADVVCSGFDCLANGDDAVCDCDPELAGDACELCANGYFGETCAACTCVHGTCADGKGGDGSCACDNAWTGDDCDACPGNWTGADCDTCAGGWSGVDCDVPVCDGGCGDGTCTAPDTCDCPGGFDPDAACATCLDGHVGPVCDACPTDAEDVVCSGFECLASGDDAVCDCDPELAGDACELCAIGYFGETCAACTCVHGTCADGKGGDGSCACDNAWTGDDCDTCPSNWQGADCDTCAGGWSGVDCDVPVCDGGCGDGTCTAPDTCECPGGFDPDAACATCLDGHVGPVCDACPIDAEDVVCSGFECSASGDDAVCDCDPEYAGDACELCAIGHFGETCAACTCVHGACADGKGGDGSCACDNAWTGDDCESCPSNWQGADCDTCAEGFDPLSDCTTCLDGYEGPDCTPIPSGVAWCGYTWTSPLFDLYFEGLVTDDVGTLVVTHPAASVGVITVPSADYVQASVGYTSAASTTEITATMTGVAEGEEAWWRFGFTGAAAGLTTVTMDGAVCDTCGGCGVHGTCEGNGECACDDGWTGDHCHLVSPDCSWEPAPGSSDRFLVYGDFDFLTTATIAVDVPTSAGNTLSPDLFTCTQAQLDDNLDCDGVSAVADTGPFGAWTHRIVHTYAADVVAIHTRLYDEVLGDNALLPDAVALNDQTCTLVDTCVPETPICGDFADQTCTGEDEPCPVGVVEDGTAADVWVPGATVVLKDPDGDEVAAEITGFSGVFIFDEVVGFGDDPTGWTLAVSEPSGVFYNTEVAAVAGFQEITLGRASPDLACTYGVVPSGTTNVWWLELGFTSLGTEGRFEWEDISGLVVRPPALGTNTDVDESTLDIDEQPPTSYYAQFERLYPNGSAWVEVVDPAEGSPTTPYAVTLNNLDCSPAD